jgi:hypothetical protein
LERTHFQFPPKNGLRAIVFFQFALVNCVHYKTNNTRTSKRDAQVTKEKRPRLFNNETKKRRQIKYFEFETLLTTVGTQKVAYVYVPYIDL